MQPFSALTRRGKLIEVLRWLCVLPLALLANTAVLQIVSAMFAAAHVVGYAEWGILLDSSILKPVRVFLFYVLPQSVFVIAGAMTAPRRQAATAMVLIVLGICFSLMAHVVFQRLGGNRVGITNYTHVAAESAGLLGGVACAVWLEWRTRRAGGTEEGG